MSAAPRCLSAAVPAERDGRTVKSLLKSEFHMAEGYIAALKLRPDGIRLDGERVHTNIRARAGQVLTVRVDDVGEENPAAPAAVPLVLRYEDPDLAVIEKPAGMVVHGADPDGAPTLANALAALGHPLLGDAFYGAAQGLDLGRPALHAAALRLRHPVTGELLRFESPLPAELRQFLETSGN